MSSGTQCDDCRFRPAFPVRTRNGPARLCLGCVAAMRASGEDIKYVRALPKGHGASPRGGHTHSWPRGLAS